MNKKTADNIINAIKPYKQYLFINEWNTICDCINHYVNDEKSKDLNSSKSVDTDEPPLRRLFFKHLTTPFYVHVLVFLAGLLLGIYGF